MRRDDDMDEHGQGRAEVLAGAGGRWASTLAGALVALVIAMGGCRSPAPPAAGGLPVPVSPSFTVGLEPTTAVPARIGEPVGLRLSSSVAGYGHLYLINVDGSVMALGGNLPLVPGVATAYPRLGDGFELRASPPAGVERLILLVTLQPFPGFGGPGGLPSTVPAPLAEAGGSDAFLNRFAHAVRALPAGSWATAEAFVQVVN